jgi:hypothetical protein
MEEIEDEEDEKDELPYRASVPHRVFVKSQREEPPVFKRSPIINPDSSYREFSTYTRRRKKRRHVLWRRALGPVILFLAVGSAAWFLLSSRQAPPFPDRVPSENPPPNIAKAPPPEPTPEEILLRLRAEPPGRGIVLGSNVNVRPDHSTAGAVVTKLNSNTRVEILNRWEGLSGSLSGPWYHIRAGEREGWIYGQYLQPLDARNSTLPPGYTAVLLKTFGTNKAALISHFGQPNQQSVTTLTWKGLTANIRGDEEITRLQLTSAEHVLSNGIAVGLSDDALYKVMGYPSEYRSGQLRYAESGGDQGVIVRTQNGKIQSISAGNI